MESMGWILELHWMLLPRRNEPVICFEKNQVLLGWTILKTPVLLIKTGFIKAQKYSFENDDESCI